jgi:hypothetical protein
MPTSPVFKMLFAFVYGTFLNYAYLVEQGHEVCLKSDDVRPKQGLFRKSAKSFFWRLRDKLHKKYPRDVWTKIE